MRVLVRKRVRSAAPAAETAEEEVLWPRGWPIPDAGTILLGRELSGWVEHVEFDIEGERVIVVLRAQ